MRAIPLLVVAFVALGGGAAWLCTRDRSSTGGAGRPAGGGNAFPSAGEGEPNGSIAAGEATRSAVGDREDPTAPSATSDAPTQPAPAAPGAKPQPTFDLPNDYELEARFAGLTKEGLVEALEQRQHILDHYAFDPSTGEGFVETRENKMTAEEFAVATREAEWLRERLER